MSVEFMQRLASVSDVVNSLKDPFERYQVLSGFATLSTTPVVREMFNANMSDKLEDFFEKVEPIQYVPHHIALLKTYGFVVTEVDRYSLTLRSKTKKKIEIDNDEVASGVHLLKVAAANAIGDLDRQKQVEGLSDAEKKEVLSRPAMYRVNVNANYRREKINEYYKQKDLPFDYDSYLRNNTVVKLPTINVDESGAVVEEIEHRVVYVQDPDITGWRLNILANLIRRAPVKYHVGLIGNSAKNEHIISLTMDVNIRTTKRDGYLFVGGNRVGLVPGPEDAAAVKRVIEFLKNEKVEMDAPIDEEICQLRAMLHHDVFDPVVFKVPALDYFQISKDTMEYYNIVRRLFESDKGLIQAEIMKEDKGIFEKYQRDVLKKFFGKKRRPKMLNTKITGIRDHAGKRTFVQVAVAGLVIIKKYSSDSFLSLTDDDALYAFLDYMVQSVANFNYMVEDEQGRKVFAMRSSLRLPITPDPPQVREELTTYSSNVEQLAQQSKEASQVNVVDDDQAIVRELGGEVFDVEPDGYDDVLEGEL